MDRIAAAAGPAPDPPPGAAPCPRAGADPEALLRLVAAAGALEPRRALLEAHGGDAAAALAAGPAAWRGCGLDRAQRQALARPDRAAIDHALRWLAQPGRHLLGWGEPDYPVLLARGVRAPLALCVAGDPARLWHPMLAVVGTRNPTPGGRDHAAAFARALAGSGLGVVSGLAAGIDTAAHEATLAVGGLTVAVLGCGPDIAYPRRNAQLLERIAAAGVVVSEHLPGTPPQKAHFPSRNRILAGLALGTLVVEAAWRSGALITARLAAEAGREVMALPGSIQNPMARGCHRLIRDGAALVETPAEVLALLAPAAVDLAEALRGRLAAPTPGSRAQPPARAGSAGDDADHQRLWQALGHDPTDMDALVSRTGLTAAELSSMLLVMELEGRVANEHGRYSRVAARRHPDPHGAVRGAGRGQ
ncbi:MAG: DNA-processing protein DprA [Gammaproteobacteria bacterium]